MLNTAEIGRKVSKADYKRELPELRTRLLKAQRDLRAAGLSTLVVIEGMDGSGRAEIANRLHEWLDPRGIQTHTFWDPSDEERERPYFWRFWRVLPGAGEIALFLGGWYRDILSDGVHKRLKPPELETRLAPVLHTENLLAADRTLILKFWYHLPRQEQEARLHREHRTPDDRWPSAAAALRGRKQLRTWAERILRLTDTADAPWFVIEAADERYRDLATGYTLLEAMENRLKEHQTHKERRGRPLPPPEPALPKAESARVTVLDRVDLSARLSDARYEKRLAKLQERLREHLWQAHGRGLTTYIVFEGWDAAGKGGTIRRLAGGMDARLYRVIPYGAPSSHELEHHYLWRFWRQVPRAGRVAVFDRSWYGRVLVERVEGLCSPAEWQRAYHEINQFEAQLAEQNGLVLKFWLHISPEEQLRRFEERQNTPWKQYKITPDDWRNREKRELYEQAVNEMVLRTDSPEAPWHLIPAEDKRHGRIRILEIICTALEARLAQGDERD
ncbi:MAG: polyphosphate:AMP phosphotransferase [Halothiobacillaceae bacterium]